MAVRVEDLVDRKVGKQYPNVEVNFSQTLPLISTDFEKGDIQVILEYSGQKKVICKISPSARNMKLILDCTGPFIYNISESQSVTISSIQEYLDVV